MKRDNFHTNVPAAQELSEEELMLVQGGGLLGDAWDWVKDKANDAVDAVTNAVTHPVNTLGKAAGVVSDIVKWFGKHYRPYPPGPGL
jgi:hypothetical protein